MVMMMIWAMKGMVRICRANLLPAYIAYTGKQASLVGA